MNLLSIEIDDLVSLMLDDAMIASKVSVSRNKETLPEDVRVHCRIAYKKYRKLKTNSQPIHQVSDKKKKMTNEQWNTKYPKSLRFRSVMEIYELISTDHQCFKDAQQYMSSKSNGSNKSSPDLVKRCRLAMIMWYCMNKPNFKKLPNYIKQFV